MTVQDAFYVQSLTDYLNDIKPYHCKLKDVLVEYQYDDQFSVRAEDYLFTSTELSSNWCQTHLLNGLSSLMYRTFNIPPVVIPRLLSDNGASKYTAYDALDFTGGEGYTSLPRPVVTLYRPNGTILTPAELGDTPTVEHGILATVSPITITGGIATGGKITGFIFYNKKLWDTGTNADLSDDPGFDSRALLTSIGTGLNFTPIVRITHPSGFGAKADCVMSGDGTMVESIVVRDQAPIDKRDVYRMPGQIDHRRLDQIAITQAGTGYLKAPIIRLLRSDVPDNPIIEDALVIAHKRDFVTAITVTNQAKGFHTAPRVTVEAPVSGTRATGIVKLYFDGASTTDYHVEAVEIVEPGSGYTGLAPNVRIHSYLHHVELLTIGKGYVDGQLPVQVLDPSGVLAHPAVVEATVINGAVVGFTVLDGGESFTKDDSTVTVVIPSPGVGPGYIQATAKAVIYGVSHDATDKIATANCSNIEIEIINPGTGYTEPPFVSVTNDTSDLTLDPDNPLNLHPSLDIYDTDTDIVTGGKQPYLSSGTGMTCQALMTGVAAWDVNIKLHNILVSPTRYTIGGPNNSLVQFNDGYAPLFEDYTFEIVNAVLDTLHIYLNDKLISLRPNFNIVLPNTDPDGGYGGSFMAPSLPEDIDDPLTVINPDYTNISLDNYDDGGYDGKDTVGIGSSARTEFYNGVLRVGTLYAPYTLPENATGYYQFIFDEKWWVLNTVINDRLMFCVAERENYNPEVLTAMVETFKISDSFYLFEHFGVSFSGQYVKSHDFNGDTLRDPTLPTYNDIVSSCRQAPPNQQFFIPYTGSTVEEHKTHAQAQIAKFEAMSKIINLPTAGSNPVVTAWQGYVAEPVLEFDGVNRRTDGLPHPVIDSVYTNTPDGVHDMEYVAIRIGPPGYNSTNGTWTRVGYQEGIDVNFIELDRLPPGYDAERGMFLGIYDSEPYDDAVWRIDPLTGMPFAGNGYLAVNRSSPGDADDEPTASMTEDMMIITKREIPADFDVGGSDMGLFDYFSYSYDASIFKTVPASPDIVPGQPEVSDDPLIIRIPKTSSVSTVTVRHNVPFIGNTLPTLIVQKWDDTANDYITPLTNGSDYTVVMMSSSIGTVGNTVLDTFVITLTIPASVRISYHWY